MRSGALIIIIQTISKISISSKIYFITVSGDNSFSHDAWILPMHPLLYLKLASLQNGVGKGAFIVKAWFLDKIHPYGTPL